jgi:hypothetical protein
MSGQPPTGGPLGAGPPGQPYETLPTGQPSRWPTVLGTIAIVLGAVQLVFRSLHCGCQTALATSATSGRAAQSYFL